MSGEQWAHRDVFPYCLAAGLQAEVMLLGWAESSKHLQGHAVLGQSGLALKWEGVGLD